MNNYIVSRCYEIESDMLKSAEKWATMTNDKELRSRLCKLMHTLAQNMARQRNILQGITLLLFLVMGVSAFGQAPRSLPKFVQNLSQEDFATWAQWQNTQTEKRASDPATVGYERPYLPGVRTTNSMSSATNFIESDTTGSNSYRGRSQKNNVSSGFRDRSGSTSTESRVFSYRNPFYNSPPPIVLYNPFVKPSTGIGMPEWDRLFILYNGKVMTVQEALEQANGPINPEKLFQNAMKPFFEN